MYDQKLIDFIIKSVNFLFLTFQYLNFDIIVHNFRCNFI